MSHCISEAKSQAAALSEGLNHSEMKALAAALGKLPTAQLEAAVALIGARVPGGLQPQHPAGATGGSRRVQIDLASHDAITLRQLQLLARKCGLDYCSPSAACAGTGCAGTGSVSQAAAAEGGEDVQGAHTAAGAGVPVEAGVAHVDKCQKAEGDKGGEGKDGSAPTAMEVDPPATSTPEVTQPAVKAPQEAAAVVDAAAERKDGVPALPSSQAQAQQANKSMSEKTEEAAAGASEPMAVDTPKGGAAAVVAAAEPGVSEKDGASALKAATKPEASQTPEAAPVSKAGDDMGGQPQPGGVEAKAAEKAELTSKADEAELKPAGTAAADSTLKQPGSEPSSTAAAGQEGQGAAAATVAPASAAHAPTLCLPGAEVERVQPASGDPHAPSSPFAPAAQRALSVPAAASASVGPDPAHASSAQAPAEVAHIAERSITDVLSPSAAGGGAGGGGGISISARAGIQWPGVPLGTGVRPRAHAFVRSGEQQMALQALDPPRFSPPPPLIPPMSTPMPPPPLWATPHSRLHRHHLCNPLTLPLLRTHTYVSLSPDLSLSRSGGCPAFLHPLRRPCCHAPAPIPGCGQRRAHPLHLHAAPPVSRGLWPPRV